MTAEKFDKEHAYNIRHNYGKEGGRKDYSAFGCSKIIGSTVQSGDHHGRFYRFSYSVCGRSHFGF